MFCDRGLLYTSDIGKIKCCQAICSISSENFVEHNHLVNILSFDHDKKFNPEKFLDYFQKLVKLIQWQSKCRIHYVNVIQGGCTLSIYVINYKCIHVSLKPNHTRLVLVFQDKPHPTKVVCGRSTPKQMPISLALPLTYGHYN